DRPQAVVSISAPADAECEKLFQGNEIDRWKRAGHIHFPTYKRGEVKIGWQFYADLQQYDAREAVENVMVPVRFIHGTEDDIVPLKNAEQLYERSNEPRDLQRVEGADHLFSSSEHQHRMVNGVVDWMEEHLA
ncbi:MAG: prolyl oligopeptidase family serine peptidase, partial [Candidatus Nanohaloarchaea archaeon]|nr:prolyl oligopeptidase family serine peptidase [Candidatus Nanohaloarchaea archaeon]